MKKIIIFDFNRTIYDPDQKRLVRGARKVLDSLKQKGLDLYLISRAENSRSDLIKCLDIKKYFLKIILVEEKGVDDFAAILSEAKVKPANCFVVGDRTKEEILLGNLLGCKTVWFKKGKFSDEFPSDESEKPFKIISRLEEVLDVVT